jgi:hypothetical protein
VKPSKEYAGEYAYADTVDSVELPQSLAFSLRL